LLVLEKSNLSKGWEFAKIDDIVELIGGGTPSRKKSEYFGGDIVWLTPTEIPRDKLTTVNTSKEMITEKGLEKSSAKIIPKNSVLLTSRATIGNVAIAGKEVTTNQGFASFICSKALHNHYLAYWLLGNKLLLNKEARGTTFKEISKSKLKELFIPIAPLNEQKRIISKIEELFSTLDSNNLLLSDTISKLNSYFTSFLKNTFEGKLTHKWRDNQKSLQSVRDLLSKKRLKIKESKKKKNQEIDKTNLPELPKEWDWTKFDEICEDSPNAIKAGPFGSSLKKEFYVSEGYKIYGQEQVIRGDSEYGDYYIDEERFEKLKSCQVKPGDLLISLVGTIGRTLILPDGIKKGIINPRLIKISLDQNVTLFRYIQIYFQSAVAKSFFKIASHGGTMDILNMRILKKLPIPLPPLAEQQKIIELYGQEFSLMNKTKMHVQEIQKKIQVLKNKILQISFEGKLVPQDPNDEPASELLKRIKASK